jgi:C4-dicarboxylate-specific signal transduction histidine kinase
VESELGKGSTFFIKLPRAIPEKKDETTLLMLQTQLEHSQKELVRERVAKEQTRQAIVQLEDQLVAVQSQSQAYGQYLAGFFQKETAEIRTEPAESKGFSFGNRLRILAQMAASLDHELSNLISPILLYSLSILRRRTDVDNEMVGLVERILHTIRWTKMVLLHMVVLSDTNQENDELVDLHQLLSEVGTILETRLLKEQRIINWQLYEEPILMAGNMVQMKQVFLNLFICACDAADEEKNFHISSTILRENGTDFAAIKLLVEGQALPPDTLDHIFSPLFMTEGETARIILGLAVCQEIIKMHSGSVDVFIDKNNNTVFEIRIPL